MKIYGDEHEVPHYPGMSQEERESFADFAGVYGPGGKAVEMKRGDSVWFHVQELTLEGADIGPLKMSVCSNCGSVVLDQEKHMLWHNNR